MNANLVAAMKQFFFAGVRLLLVFLMGSGCRKASAPQQGPLPVNVVTVVEKEVNEWDEFTGRLDPVESVEIRPRVSGYITEIHFEAGAIVKKGDLLHVIDPRTYEADLDRAAAEVDRMDAHLKLAEIELNRAKELRGKSTISASEFDQKAATLHGAAADKSPAEAARNAAALNLEFTQIRSPIDGRVSDQRITIGNLVQPGAGPESLLTTVVSVDPIYAKVDADENAVLKYVKLSEEGKRVSARTAKIPAWIELGNETDFPHEGTIDFVGNRLDPGTATAGDMNFPHFFIDRPIFAGVISIVITLVGVIALSTLPIAQYPDIAPPTIQVTASYPGANAKVVSETVATPIEQQVNGVENMLYMSSQSASDGNMTLSITFKLGTNLDTAQVLVQNRVAIAIPVLPPDVQRIGVTTKKQSPDITMVVHLASPDGSLDQPFTSNYALLQIRDELARVDGVGDINVFGAREYSMRLWLDPNKLSSRGLTAQDVVTAVQEQNVQVAAGIIGAPPVPKGATAFQYTVSTQGRLADEKEFGGIIA